MPTVRPASEADLPALSRLDLTYPTRRYLEIERTGDAPEHTFVLRWRERESPDAVYNTYSEDWLRDALASADLFLIAECAGPGVGLLIILLPAWTDAAEISDLAVDRASRGTGAGTMLVEAAAKWAKKRGKRALWVEPRAGNAEAIEFYLRRGFRISGFNDGLYSNADDDPGKQTVYLHREL